MLVLVQNHKNKYKMKKLLIFLIVVSLSGTLAAQNWYQFLTVFHGGIKVGNTVKKTGANKTGSLLLTIDSIRTDNTTTPTLYKVYRNNTQLIPDVPAGGYEDAATIFGKLLPDSVQHTANYTLALTDANKDNYCVKATSIVITIPANASVAVPIGTTFNFYGEGAGIMVFKAAANVHLHSDKDSIATSRIHQVVGLKKRGLNYWILYGNLID